MSAPSTCGDDGLPRSSEREARHQRNGRPPYAFQPHTWRRCGGGTHAAGALNIVHTRAACLADLNEHAVRLMKRREWY